MLGEVLDALFGDNPAYNEWRSELITLWEKKPAQKEPKGSSGSELVLPPGMPPRTSFVGREDELSQLHTLLTTDKRATQPAGPVILTGMPGVGKTSLAAAYVRRYGSQYGGVWWCRAESTISLITSLGQLHRFIEPDFPEQADLAEAARAALRSLTQMTAPWLLIYDNVPSPSEITEYLPPQGVSHIVTSRLPFWSKWGTSLPIDVFSLEVATDFLKSAAPNVDGSGADALAELLGQLPLALDHAAAFCESSGSSFSDYSSKAQHLLRVLPANSNYPTSVAATFEIALAQAARKAHGAEDLMDFLAQCAPDPIPVSLAKAALQDDVESAHAVSALSELSLITHATFADGASALMLHRVVRSVAWTKAEGRGTARRSKERLVQELSLLFPKNDQVSRDNKYWPLCDRLLPHIFGWVSEPSDSGVTRESWSQLMQRATAHGKPAPPWLTFARRYLRWIVKRRLDPLELWPELVERAADYLFARKSLVQAEQLWRAILMFWERLLDSTNPKIANILNNLAVILQAQDRLVDARTLFERTLAIYEHNSGPDSIDIATPLDNLGALLMRAGDLQGGRQAIERAARIRETHLEPNHPDIARSLERLASCAREQGDLASARPLVERALAIMESALGPAHPQTLAIMTNVATLYTELRDFPAARPLCERILSLSERTFGSTHSETALALNNLGRVLQDQGDLDGARQLFERALTISEDTLGLEHHRTADVLNNLAAVHEEQGDLETAQILYERSMSISEHLFGTNHAAVALRCANLAGLFVRRGEFDKGRTLHERALAIREDAFGPQHPDVGTSLVNLAQILVEQGLPSAAEPLFHRSLEIAERSFGPDDSETAIVLGHLSRVCRDQGRFDEALQLNERALLIFEKALGPDHHYTGTCRCDLAGLSRIQGDLGAARTLYEHALATFERSMGPEHFTTVMVMNNLAELLRDQGDLISAKPLLERALQISEKASGSNHPDTNRIRCNLANVLIDVGTDLETALELAQLALAGHEEAFGRSHFQTIASATAAAATLDALNRHPEAADLRMNYGIS